MTQVLAAIEAAARAGGAVLRERYAARGTLVVEEKRAGDYVSDADRSSEDAIRVVLERADPTIGFLLEESGAFGDVGRRWVVDPLDGTTNFLHGIPHFAVSIALVHAGVVEAGVVYQPLTDETFAATPGTATLHGHPMRVSACVDLGRAVVATGVPHRGIPWHAPFAAQLAGIAPKVSGIRRFGSAALDLAWVAAGRYDAFWESGLQPWDVAAGILLVEAAGGEVVGLYPGTTPLGGSLVAAPPALMAEVRAALGSLV